MPYPFHATTMCHLIVLNTRNKQAPDGADDSTNGSPYIAKAIGCIPKVIAGNVLTHPKRYIGLWIVRRHILRRDQSIWCLGKCLCYQSVIQRVKAVAELLK